MQTTKMVMRTKDIVLIGMMSAILIIVQIALAFLPNIELVSLLIIIYTLIFGRKTIYIIYVFVALEGIFYGFGLWWFSYLYLWLILYFITIMFKKVTSSFYWAIISGFFGLSFGAFYTIVIIITAGPAAGLASWISGIPFDLPHCIGNFVLALVLFKPLYHVLNKANKQFFSK